MSTLFVDRRDVHLELESGAIVFRENGERVGTVPIAPLTRVFLRGNVTLQAKLLAELGEHDIGVVILTGRKGTPALMLSRPHNDAARRIEQVRLSLDPRFCLRYARQLVSAKILAQVQWFDRLRATDLQHRYELTHAMQLLQQQRDRLPQATQLGTLRGMEGAAGAAYFEGLRTILPESLRFTGRNRRPPRDPFNALLSLTYTLAHAEVAIALHGAGFDPSIGFYHQISFGRESLASDLLEPVRPVADQFCLRLIREQTLTADHFSQTNAGCLLGKAGRAHYYEAYETCAEPLRNAIGQVVQDLVRATTETGDARESVASAPGPEPAEGVA